MEDLIIRNKMVSVVRKSLIDGLTIASGSKSSSTYYHSSDEQIKAIKKAVSDLYSLSKELPLILATQKGSTGKFISEVILNELKNTTLGGACNVVNPIDWYDNGIGDIALASALNRLSDDNGITYVLRLFVDLKKNKINNGRTRRLVLNYILGNENLEFYSVKYRNKIAEILTHIYGVRKLSILLSIFSKITDNNIILNNKELNILNNNVYKYINSEYSLPYVGKLLMFIFRSEGDVTYNETKFPIINEYIKAKTNIDYIRLVPEEVQIGLISNTNHPQHNKFWGSESKRELTKAMIRNNVTVTSSNQLMRKTKNSKKIGATNNVNINKVTDFLALYKTGYENGFTIDINKRIDELAIEKSFKNFEYKNIGIIVDNSDSMNGHSVESKNTPKAIADFTSKILSKSADASIKIGTESGITNLADSFISLLRVKDDYDAIFIITDGYENVYDGLLNEVINVWREMTNTLTPIFQISPITGSETGSNVRNIGSDVIKLSVNDPISINPQIQGRLLEIDTKKWLINQISALV